MSLARRPFGGADGHEPPAMPWDRKPSIFEFIRSRIAAGLPAASASPRGGGVRNRDARRAMA
jgi:hypothetical protein